MTELDWQEWVNWRKNVDAAIEKLHGGQKRMSDKLEENTQLTKAVDAKVATLTEQLGGFPAFMVEGHNTFKFVRRLATLAKWLLVFFVAPILAVVILTGHAPEWVKTLWTLIMEFNI